MKTHLRWHVELAVVAQYRIAHVHQARVPGLAARNHVLEVGQEGGGTDIPRQDVGVGEKLVLVQATDKLSHFIAGYNLPKEKRKERTKSREEQKAG